MKDGIKYSRTYKMWQVVVITKDLIYTGYHRNKNIASVLYKELTRQKEKEND